MMPRLRLAPHPKERGTWDEHLDIHLVEEVQSVESTLEMRESGLN